MPILPENITSLNWSLSLSDAGKVVQDAEAIKQRVDVLLSTVPGSDPLRPLFGCNYWQWIDASLDIAVPNIKKAITDALQVWLPEIVVTAVRHYPGEGGIRFEIRWKSASGVDALTLDWSKGTFTTNRQRTSILTASIVIGGGSWRVQLRNATSVVFESVPFADLGEALAWLRDHQEVYGVWGRLSAGIVLHLKPVHQPAWLQIL